MLQNWCIQYCVHKSLTLVSTLSHINLIHVYSSYLFTIHFNIILPPIFLSIPNGYFLSCFLIKTLRAFSFYPMHVTCSAVLILFDLISNGSSPWTVCSRVIVVACAAHLICGLLLNCPDYCRLLLLLLFWLLLLLFNEDGLLLGSIWCYGLHSIHQLHTRQTCDKCLPSCC